LIKKDKERRRVKMAGGSERQHLKNALIGRGSDTRYIEAAGPEAALNYARGEGRENARAEVSLSDKKVQCNSHHYADLSVQQKEKDLQNKTNRVYLTPVGKSTGKSDRNQMSINGGFRGSKPSEERGNLILKKVGSSVLFQTSPRGERGQKNEQEA